MVMAARAGSGQRKAEKVSGPRARRRPRVTEPGPEAASRAAQGSQPERTGGGRLCFFFSSSRRALKKHHILCAPCSRRYRETRRPLPLLRGNAGPPRSSAEPTMPPAAAAAAGRHPARRNRRPAEGAAGGRGQVTPVTRKPLTTRPPLAWGWGERGLQAPPWRHSLKPHQLPLGTEFLLFF